LPLAYLLSFACGLQQRIRQSLKIKILALISGYADGPPLHRRASAATFALLDPGRYVIKEEFS